MVRRGLTVALAMVLLAPALASLQVRAADVVLSAVAAEEVSMSSMGLADQAV